MMRSSECRYAIPRAMSKAQRTACAVSTTIPVARCSKLKSEPRVINYLSIFEDNLNEINVLYKVYGISCIFKRAAGLQGILSF